MTIERSVARLLTIGTSLGVGALAVGTLLMIREGIDPLEAGYPTLDLAALPADLLGLRPTAWLWVGILVILATPIARVGLALLGFLTSGERQFALVALAILMVIGTGVAIGALGG
jgi:uncharacterized membrane protein